MAFVDIFVVAVLLLALWQGWQAGFLKQLASFVGLLVGLFIASSLYSALGDYLAPRMGAGISITRFLAFVLLWIVVPIVLGMLATLLTKALPGVLGVPNRLLGMVVSTGKYLLLLSCLFNVMSFMHILSEQKQQKSFLFTPVKGALSFAFHEVSDKVKSKVKTEEKTGNDTTYIYNNKNHDAGRTE